MTPATPVPSARRRALRALAGALAVVSLVPAAACDPSGPDDHRTTTPQALSTIRDPLADLDRNQWSVVDGPTMMAQPVDKGDVDTAAWAAAGIDDARITAARQALADYIVGSYFEPEHHRTTDDATDQKEVLDKAPDPWKDAITQGWSKDRQFYITEFPSRYRVIGRPRAVVAWYLTDRDGKHLVEVGGTIAFSILDTRTGDVGWFVNRFGGSVVPGGAGGPAITEGNFIITLSGSDTCKTDKQKGLIVPAIGTSSGERSAQQVTRRHAIDRPQVTRADIAEDDKGALHADVDATVGC